MSRLTLHAVILCIVVLLAMVRSFDPTAGDLPLTAGSLTATDGDITIFTGGKSNLAPDKLQQVLAVH